MTITESTGVLGRAPSPDALRHTAEALKTAVPPTPHLDAVTNLRASCPQAAEAFNVNPGEPKPWGPIVRFWTPPPVEPDSPCRWWQCGLPVGGSPVVEAALPYCCREHADNVFFECPSCGEDMRTSECCSRANRAELARVLVEADQYGLPDILLPAGGGR